MIMMGFMGVTMVVGSHEWIGNLFVGTHDGVGWCSMRENRAQMDNLRRVGGARRAPSEL